MPEETIREIILSLAENYDSTNSITSRQSNVYGSTHSIVGCYIPIKGPKTLFNRKRSSVVLDERRKSMRNVHGTAIYKFQPSDTELQPTRRPSLKIQAGKMIQKVRKSLSIHRKGACKRFHNTNSQVSFEPFPNYFEIDFIAACLLHL